MLCSSSEVPWEHQDCFITSPCADHPTLVAYDQRLRKGLEDILNINLTDTQWIQSTLPIAMGGLGIRRVSSLAIAAFLASAVGTLALQSDILRLWKIWRRDGE